MHAKLEPAAHNVAGNLAVNESLKMFDKAWLHMLHQGRYLKIPHQLKKQLKAPTLRASLITANPTWQLSSYRNNQVTNCCTFKMKYFWKIFVSVTSILYHSKFSCDLVKLQLIESHCLSILTYAMDCLNTPKVKLFEISSWWNTVYRKIFGYHKWESVKEVICRLGRLDFPHLLSLRRSSFLKNMSLSDNFVFASIAMSNKCICEMLMLKHTSRVKLCWSLAKIKASTHALFKMTCGVEACV